MDGSQNQQRARSLMQDPRDRSKPKQRLLGPKRNASRSAAICPYGPAAPCPYVHVNPASQVAAPQETADTPGTSSSMDHGPTVGVPLGTPTGQTQSFDVLSNAGESQEPTAGASSDHMQSYERAPQ